MKKILIIDDEPQIVLLSAHRLEVNGYAVITASSGEQGLKKAKKEMPDLILLDQVMPEMDGWEALERLKKDSLTKSIRVLMFTADVKKVKVGEAQMLGAVGCLFKPFSPEELLAKVKEVLHKKP
jgi:two-component system alkaline phosphatase synthesis response regulator PhoP